MSLGRFLAAGKSWMGMKEGDGRYQMRSKDRLPKFDSKKNPFTQTTMPEVGKVESPVHAPEPVEPAPMAMSEFFETNSEVAELAKAINEAIAEPTVQQIELSAAPAVSTASVSQKADSTWMKDLLKKLNPLPRIASLKAGQKVKAPKLARTHVQTELSLEKVKPVRNDLSDSDLEVVTPKRVVLPKGPQPYLKPMAKPETTTTWNRLTSRIFGPTEVR